MVVARNAHVHYYLAPWTLGIVLVEITITNDIPKHYLKNWAWLLIFLKCDTTCALAEMWNQVSCLVLILMCSAINPCFWVGRLVSVYEIECVISCEELVRHSAYITTYSLDVHRLTDKCTQFLYCTYRKWNIILEHAQCMIQQWNHILHSLADSMYKWEIKH